MLATSVRLMVVEDEELLRTLIPYRLTTNVGTIGLTSALVLAIKYFATKRTDKF
jgi:hypothetical protein